MSKDSLLRLHARIKPAIPRLLCNLFTACSALLGNAGLVCCVENVSRSVMTGTGDWGNREMLIAGSGIRRTRCEVGGRSEIL